MEMSMDAVEFYFDGAHEAHIVKKPNKLWIIDSAMLKAFSRLVVPDLIFEPVFDVIQFLTYSPQSFRR